jgi:hypothetical protein
LILASSFSKYVSWVLWLKLTVSPCWYSDRGFAMARYIVSTEERMLDVVERLMVEHGVVIASREEMFDTLVIETDDPLTVSQIEGVLQIRAAP